MSLKSLRVRCLAPSPLDMQKSIGEPVAFFRDSFLCPEVFEGAPPCSHSLGHFIQQREAFFFFRTPVPLSLTSLRVLSSLALFEVNCAGEVLESLPYLPGQEAVMKAPADSWQTFSVDSATN